MRDPSAIDYSKTIFDWLRNSKDEALEKWDCIISGELQQKQKALLGGPTTSRLPHFKAFNMHKTRFCDLKFRLGAGYLYCHQVEPYDAFVIMFFYNIEANKILESMATRKLGDKNVWLTSPLGISVRGMGLVQFAWRY